MKKYEAVYILDIRKVEDDGDAFSKEFAGVVEALGGKVELSTPMGRKQFTYDIKKRKAGIYWDYILTLGEDKLATLKDKYRLDERVLRNMILIYDRPDNADAAAVKVEIEN